MPSILFSSLYGLYKRWMACQRVTLIAMIVMIVGTFAHVIFCYIFVNVFDAGIVGLAYASTLKDLILMVTIMIYARCSSQVNEALSPVDMDSFRGWGEYICISLPSAVMICAEWWAFEILTILAGLLGVD